jgi:hypothetical protein
MVDVDVVEVVGGVEWVDVMVGWGVVWVWVVL